MQSLIKAALTLIFLVTFGWASAQVIPAPTINCVSVNESNGDVVISFTPAPLNPCGTFTDYKIYGTTDTVNGPFLLVGTVTNPNTTRYTHTGANATIVKWYYYAEMEQNCAGATSAHSYFSTGQLLEVPVFTYVTVTSGGVQINWKPASTPAVDSFVVFYINPSNGLAISMDTLPRTATSYLDAIAAHVGSAYSYTIKALDACGTPTIQQPLEHNNIFMDVVSNACLQKATISWNAYHNWVGDTASYHLETTIDGGTPTLTLINNPFPAGSPITVRQSVDYSIKDLTGNNICFRLIASDGTNTYTSASNPVCLPLQVLRSTAYNLGSFGSVLDTNKITVQWVIDTVAQIADFQIKRGTDSINTQVVGTVLAGTNDVFEPSFTDSTVNTAAGSYYYNIVSRDSCGFEITSTSIRTIFASVASESANINTVSWNAFQLSGASVLNYTVYRVRKDGSAIALATVLPDVFTFDDAVGDAVSDNGTFCYRIISNYVLNVPFLNISKTYTTRSNDVCIGKDPVVYIPNAFVPGGVNKTFKPVLLFGVSQYDFKVFDRWGKQVFYTQDVVAGWDGTYKGEKLPLGGYAYQLKVVSATGIEITRQGVVALIR